MAVKIRFSRIGKAHAPIYRIVAVDERAKRDGKFIENLGTYNPLNHILEQWHADRIEYWVSQGAQKTDAVKRLEAMVKKGKVNRPGQPKVVDKKRAVSYDSPVPKRVEEAPAESQVDAVDSTQEAKA
jgi:small subunit ribosomal protein S16